MQLLQAISDGHRASDGDYGIALGIRGGQAGNQVGAPRPGRDQGHSRFFGHATDAASDERSVLFMPADHGLDFGI
jgi:hypothetical protein